MKRRQRRPVLDINSEQSESPRGRWQNKYQQIAVDHPEQNGNPNNPLASLLGQYNSDSETEDVKQESNQLNDKVNDFLKEIQMIIPDTVNSNNTKKTTDPTIPSQRSSQPGQNETSNSPWQECFDETTGYPYYWHIETNEVTWEMPSEMRLHREKSSQVNQNQNQVAIQHQTHPAHTQVQWPNFLPNTYPELQTNIPEGMIPKEVVARNRNRQVGISRGNQPSTELTTEAPKKTGPKDDESDDEKIEMITSFGDDESESDGSDSDSALKKSTCDKVSAQKIHKLKEVCKNSLSEVEESPSIGPFLPLEIIPMIHGPENVSENGNSHVDNGIESVTKAEGRDENVYSSRKIENSLVNQKVTVKSEDSEEENILMRLKNQAKLLQSLGGEVPESVETLIKDEVNDQAENLEQDDIISQIEKEMPVDHARNFSSISKMKSETLKGLSSESSRLQETKKNKDIKISLVAGYSDDSDFEEETSPKKTGNAQPLFPIMSNYTGKENSDNVLHSTLKVSDEFNPAKDVSVVNLGIKGAEQKQWDFVNAGKLSNSSAEDADNADGDSRGTTDNTSQSALNGQESLESGETRTTRLDPELSRQQTFLENLEMPVKGFQRKKRIAFDVVPNKISKPQSESVTNQASRTEPSSLTFSTTGTSLDESERHGFGFHKESKAQPDVETGDSSGEVSRDRITSNKQKTDKETSQSNKCISFVKGETTESSISTEENVKSEVDKPIVDNKQLKEMTEIVMEKIKFLSEGSQNLSAIQIMVIQLQTLVGAWEAGDLKEGYLHEWLKGTGLELGRLEQAAAPPGWDCHWDRSHKRYYYRNSVTGEAQWTYPEADVVGGTEEMDLCTTPPPPEDEGLQLIEEASNETEQKPKLDSMPLIITGDNKIIQVTKDEYKSLEAPPPPQISSPSPPPPPRIFAADLKKGKKRRGSTSERSLDSKKEKTETAGSLSDGNVSVDPPLPSSPPKNPSQPPLPPTPPHPAVIPNPPSSEPLPPGVDPKDMPYPLPAVTAVEQSVVYPGPTQQTNPIYAATISDRGIAVPIIDHRSTIIQGQLMHYPTYQHLHNQLDCLKFIFFFQQQAMIAAAGSLTGQEAVQFVITDYAQVYANTQVIAKPPVKSQTESLGSALDSFYSDIASIEKTNSEQECMIQQDIETRRKEAATPPLATLPNTVITSSSHAEIEQPNASIDLAGKEKKKKKTKIGIGKKQKEMSTMVAKWQKAQQDFGDSE
nr:formin-binding protein 4-like isoform X1 [Neodiprion pinetum]